MSDLSATFQAPFPVAPVLRTADKPSDSLFEESMTRRDALNRTALPPLYLLPRHKYRKNSFRMQ